MPQTTLPKQRADGDYESGGPIVSFVWEVDPSSPVETFLPGQGRATAVVRTAYDLRQPFLDLVAGYSYERILGGKRVLSRITPLAYPYHRGLYCTGAVRAEGKSPGLPGMPEGTTSKTSYVRYAPGAAVETFKVPNGLNLPEYLDCKIELVFSTLEYRVRLDSEVISKDNTNNWLGKPDEGDALARGIKRYITRTATDTGKLITIPGNFLYYKDFGIPVPQSSSAIYQFSQDLVYDWFDIPESCIPYTAITKSGACVNNAVFDGYPAQTLLFKGYGLKRVTDIFGMEKYQMRYVFRFLPNFDAIKQRARGHNWVLAIGPKYNGDGTNNPDSGKLVYLEVCSRGDTAKAALIPNKLPARPATPLNGTSPFPPVDFRDLFRPEQP